MRRVHLLADVMAALRFYTRLPLGVGDGEMLDFAGAAWAVPLAGAFVGAVGGSFLLVSDALGLGTTPTALIGLATTLVVSGALHEDGLADCADGFGGGATIPRKLEIMRDSRLGTYGVCAVVISLFLRGAALADLVETSPYKAAAVMVAAGALSRTLALWPLATLPAARTDGAGAHATRPALGAIFVALLVAWIMSVPAMNGAGFARTITIMLLAAGAVCIVTWLAWRQIGGQTGDVIGAAQQVAEILAMLGFAGH